MGVPEFSGGYPPVSADAGFGMSVHNSTDPCDEAVKGWRPMLQSFDDGFLPERHELVAKTQDATRNTSYLAAGIRSQIYKTVGDYYRISYEPDYRALGMSPANAVKFVEAVESLFEQDAQDDENWFDASGRMNFTELCACSMYTHYDKGENFLLAEYLRKARDKGSRPFATAISMINPDRIFTPPMLIEDHLLRAGFRKTKKGYAYQAHIMNRHPYDFHMYNTKMPKDEFVRINRHTKQRYENWRHIFVTEAPDQSRGRSQMISGLMDSRMLSKFNRAVLSNAITQGMYAAVIESQDPISAFQGIMTNGGGSDTARTAAEKLELARVRDAHYDPDGKSGLRMNNARIAQMLDGDTLKFTTPNGTLDQVDPFAAIFFRNIARTLDVTYEELTGDYTKTNFSGARAGTTQSDNARRTIAARVPRPAGRYMFRLWLEEQFSTGRLSVPGFGSRTSRQRHNLFLNNKQALCNVDFHGPGVDHIDPVKGTEGSMNEMRMRVLTRKQYTNQHSTQSWRKIFDQTALEQAEAEARGIELDAGLKIEKPVDPIELARVQADLKDSGDDTNTSTDDE